MGTAHVTLENQEPKRLKSMKDLSSKVNVFEITWEPYLVPRGWYETDIESIIQPIIRLVLNYVFHIPYSSYDY